MLVVPSIKVQRIFLIYVNFYEFFEVKIFLNFII